MVFKVISSGSYQCQWNLDIFTVMATAAANRRFIYYDLKYSSVSLPQVHSPGDSSRQEVVCGSSLHRRRCSAAGVGFFSWQFRVDVGPLQGAGSSISSRRCFACVLFVNDNFWCCCCPRSSGALALSRLVVASCVSCIRL